LEKPLVPFMNATFFFVFFVSFVVEIATV
jgi:hypothetical protein